MEAYNSHVQSQIISAIEEIELYLKMVRLLMRRDRENGSQKTHHALDNLGYESWRPRLAQANRDGSQRTLLAHLKLVISEMELVVDTCK